MDRCTEVQMDNMKTVYPSSNNTACRWYNKKNTWLLLLYEATDHLKYVKYEREMSRDWKHEYRNNPKYWDTLSTCHMCPKIWNRIIYYLLMSLKYCCMYGKQCRPWSDTTFWGVWSGSTLFARPICPNNKGCYGNQHIINKSALVGHFPEKGKRGTEELVIERKTEKQMWMRDKVRQCRNRRNINMPLPPSVQLAQQVFNTALLPTLSYAYRAQKPPSHSSS